MKTRPLFGLLAADETAQTWRAPYLGQPRPVHSAWPIGRPAPPVGAVVMREAVEAALAQVETDGAATYEGEVGEGYQLACADLRRALEALP